MDYRKNCHTPRDMVDDGMLARLLEESEMSMGQYGKSSARSAQSSCGCRNRNPHQRPMPYMTTQRQQMRNDMREARQEMENDREHECMKEEMCEVCTCLSGKHLAMAYHPDHEWSDMYEVEDALSHGTMFRGLDLPFYPACESCK